MVRNYDIFFDYFFFQIQKFKFGIVSHISWFVIWFYFQSFILRIRNIFCVQHELRNATSKGQIVTGVIRTCFNYLLRIFICLLTSESQTYNKTSEIQLLRKNLTKYIILLILRWLILVSNLWNKKRNIGYRKSLRSLYTWV